MAYLGKVASLIVVVVLAVSSLIIVKTTFAVAQPSVPEFTIKLVDHSYDVPTTYTTTTDPYTGKQTVTTHPGYHVQNRTIEVTIKNQQFTPYSIDNQRTIYLFYNITYKGHYASDWNYYPWNGSFGRNSDATTRIPQSTSDYTVIPFTAPTEGQMDFRVQAQIGYYNESQLWVAVPGAPFSTYRFIGEVSGWSNTQTITIPDNASTTFPSVSPSPLTPIPTASSSPSQNPTTTPAQSGAQAGFLFGLDWEKTVVVVLVVVVVCLAVGMVVLWRRVAAKPDAFSTKKTSTLS